MLVAPASRPTIRLPAVAGPASRSCACRGDRLEARDDGREATHRRSSFLTMWSVHAELASRFVRRCGGRWSSAVRALRIWRVAARPPRPSARGASTFDTGASRRQWWCCGSYFRSTIRVQSRRRAVTTTVAERVTVHARCVCCAAAANREAARVRVLPASKGVSSPAVWSS